MRPAIVVAILLVLGLTGWVLMGEHHTQNSCMESLEPRRVSVQLLAPTHAIVGMEVPKDLARQRGAYLRVQEPADVTVQLPDDKSVRIRVKYVSVNVNDGVVVDVHLLPLMQSVSFRESVAELHRCMGVIDITPDERMKDMMATWPEDTPGFRPGLYPHTYRAEVSLSESATFLVKVRPADDGGWFLVLTFATDGAARRALWDPDLRELTKRPPGDGVEGREDDQSPSAASPRPISISLLGSAEAIAGLEVPEGLAATITEYLRVPEPADLTVHLPGGRSARLPARYVIVRADYGTVLDVHLLPLMQPVPFGEAVAELRRCLRVLDVTPDEEMQRRMAEWPDDPPRSPDDPPPPTYVAGTAVSEDVRLDALLRPHPDGGWFLTLILEAAGDARRRAGRGTQPRPADVRGDGIEGGEGLGGR